MSENGKKEKDESRENRLDLLPPAERIKRIETVAARLGMPAPAKRPVLKIRPGENDNEKIIQLERGSWQDEKPWFVIDEEGKLLVLTSAESMMAMMRTLQQMGQEVFKSRLEKAIAQELPVDFHDVWTVAMHELRDRLEEEGGEAAAVDLENLIKSIKRRHPNLFYSLGHIETGEEA